jgi:hypothetical protein
MPTRRQLHEVPAAESLKDQAHKLAGVVSTFRVEARVTRA